MQTCYNCGKQVSDETLICPECGALVKRYTAPARNPEQDASGHAANGASASGNGRYAPIFDDTPNRAGYTPAALRTTAATRTTAPRGTSRPIRRRPMIHTAIPRRSAQSPASVRLRMRIRRDPSAAASGATGTAYI